MASDLRVRRGGRLVLPGVSLEVAAGTVTGLLGPSGSGKTTLMRAIVGVQIVEAGAIRVLGLPAGSPPLWRRVGYVTQEPSVYGDMSVRENLRYFARILGAPPSRVDEAIDEVDLRAQADQLTRTLSGGERSRVSLATALLGRAELLVLDEPTVGLDPVLRRDLWTLFHGLAQTGRTLLVSSHVMDEAERCDELVLMRDGTVVATGSPIGLLERTGAANLEQAFLDAGGGSVSVARTLATAERVLRQLRHDRRTLALVFVVPPFLLTLFRYVFDGQPETFDRVGGPLVGIFPFTSMFLVTSIAMLRERTSGTLERLMSMPIAKGDLLGGYGLAFAAVAAVQASITSAVAFGLLGLDTAGPIWAVVADRGRERAPRDGARPLPERLRDDGVSGGSVHARGGDPADPALRPARAARGDGGAARVALEPAPAHLRVRRARAGDGERRDRRGRVARRRHRRRLHRACARARIGDAAPPDALTVG